MAFSARIVVAVRVMGGKPEIFGSLKECSEKLELSYGSLRNFFSEGKGKKKKWDESRKWQNDEWVIYRKEVEKKGSRGKDISEMVEVKELIVEDEPNINDDRYYMTDLTGKRVKRTKPRL